MNDTIGFLGLGKMGAGMAARLVETGHELIVWNRTRSKTAALESIGATVAQRPANVAESCNTIITMLNDDASAAAVYCGDHGLLTQPVDGKLFIEMSTLRPETSRSIAARCADLGASFIDSPVSGTVGPARSGRLMALVGGAEADVERARPVLESMTRRIVHVGPVGNGALMKLVLNLPLVVYWQALAEALALGRSGGLDLETMLEVVADSGGALSALSHKIESIAGKSDEAAFDVATTEKDARSILALGQQYGISMPATQAALSAYAAANAAGLGEKDSVVIIERLLASLDLKPAR